MTAVPMAAPSLQRPFVDPDGYLTVWGRNFITGAYNRMGGPVDKIDQAFALASGAVPNTVEVIASSGIEGGGDLTGNVSVRLGVGDFTVATLPAVASGRQWAFALDGRKNGEGAGLGSGTWVWFDSTNWIAVDSGAPVTA